MPRSENAERRDHTDDAVTERGRVARMASTAVIVLLVALAWSGVIDRYGGDYADGVFRRALVTFAVARGLDAAISMAQGTEIALQPAGVGVTLGAGEILDPVNDLVEQFSWVMLVSTTSLGGQKVLLRISAARALTLIVAAAVLAWIAVTWLVAKPSPRLEKVIRHLLVVALALRFTMPLVAIGSSLIFEHFLAEPQAESVRMLEETGDDIREIERLDDDAEELGESGALGRLSTWFSDALGELDVQARIEAFRERVAGATEHIINLIVVFTLQTVLMPLGFLWLLPRALGFAVRQLG